ncbi:MAG: hypothetical protein GX465_11300 [Acidobacteria bacterium]|nr:hypothetical protein [Acidobacteriota bacterium]
MGGGTGTADGLFGIANGIAFDSNGYVYVAEGDNNRVQVFRVIR